MNFFKLHRKTNSMRGIINAVAKKTVLLVVLTLCIAVLGNSGFYQTDCKATSSYETKAAALLKSEMSLSNNLADKLLKSTGSLPFTYALNGKKYRGIPTSWNPVKTIKPVDANIVKTTIRGTDPKTKLKLTFEMSIYKDYPVVEWIVWFEDTGKSKTQIISNLKAIDYTFQGSDPYLTHCNGDFNSATGYTMEKTKISGTQEYFEPTNGRPSDGAFPYYRMNFKDYGITMAIGWPCQWFASFKGTSKSVSVSSGQSNLTTYLNPGEKIRSPRMTILMYKNGEENGINVWRSWFRDHILIKEDGKEIQPIYANSAADGGDWLVTTSEANQLKYMDKFTQKGFDFNVWWIDAGWYYCYDKTKKQDLWYNVGDWRPDPTRYPNGLKSISDKAHSKGAKLLLWFEPERVFKGYGVYNEHPEWLLKDTTNPSYLLNIGIPACREWITNKIDKLIKDFGVDIYRQDYNYWAPLNMLQSNEKDNRYGIVENQYVQGYLRYWDDLKARNPSLLIDSCAGGGRRNDLETLRRAVPLHYSDYATGDTVTLQGFHNTLYQWFLFFKDIPSTAEISKANSLRDKNNQLDPNNDVDEFSDYVTMAPLYGSGVDIRNDNFDFATTLKFKKYWEQINHQLIDGDFYILSKNTRKDDIWTVRQFDLPKTNEGIFQVFRNINNKDASFTIKPKGSISADLTFEITNVATEAKTVISGADWLNKGFIVTLGRREACLLKYKAVQN